MKLLQENKLKYGDSILLVFYATAILEKCIYYFL